MASYFCPSKYNMLTSIMYEPTFSTNLLKSRSRSASRVCNKLLEYYSLQTTWREPHVAKAVIFYGTFKYAHTKMKPSDWAQCTQCFNSQLTAVTTRYRHYYRSIFPLQLQQIIRWGSVTYCTGSVFSTSFDWSGSTVLHFKTISSCVSDF